MEVWSHITILSDEMASCKVKDYEYNNSSYLWWDMCNKLVSMAWLSDYISQNTMGHIYLSMPSSSQSSLTKYPRKGYNPLGFYSVRDRMSYHQILWSLEAINLNVKWQCGSGIWEEPCWQGICQSFRAIWQLYIHIPQLYPFVKF